MDFASISKHSPLALGERKGEENHGKEWRGRGRAGKRVNAIYFGSTYLGHGLKRARLI